MTLIATMATDEFVVLASDRRLLLDGTPAEDESNKAAVLVCRDARLAIAFTGLARAGSFVTNRWLLETLGEVAEPDFSMAGIVARFTERATRDIASLSVSRPTDKRLSVVLAGFHYEEDPPRPYCWRVSNFEAEDEVEVLGSNPWPEFKAELWRTIRPGEGGTHLILLSGVTAGVSEKDVISLRTLLKDGKPSRAVVGKTVECIQSAADSPASHGSVGKQCTSIVVPAKVDVPTASEYHSAVRARKIHGVSYIEARGGDFGVWMLADPETWVPDKSGSPTTVAVPKVRRNEPCPCGSGRKYKLCHGRANRRTWEMRIGG